MIIYRSVSLKKEILANKINRGVIGILIFNVSPKMPISFNHLFANYPNAFNLSESKNTNL